MELADTILPLVDFSIIALHFLRASWRNALYKFVSGHGCMMSIELMMWRGSLSNPDDHEAFISVKSFEFDILTSAGF